MENKLSEARRWINELLTQTRESENKEWREGRRCGICGAEKNPNLADMCADCFKNS